VELTTWGFLLTVRNRFTTENFGQHQMFRRFYAPCSVESYRFQGKNYSVRGWHEQHMHSLLTDCMGEHEGMKASDVKLA
jgi:hypothetical protein